MKIMGVYDNDIDTDDEEEIPEENKKYITKRQRDNFGKSLVN